MDSTAVDILLENMIRVARSWGWGDNSKAKREVREIREFIAANIIE